MLGATRDAPQQFGMSGGERALIYELAATTGLRASELASLTAASFTLADSPSVTIAAAYAKNRRQDTLPLRAPMAALLREFLTGKLPGAKAFPELNKDHTAEMLKADLAAAGLPFDLDGKVFDFHALRHQFISSLAAAGVHPKTAQQLTRHSTITLTMDNYTHVFRGDLDKAIDALADWHTPEHGPALATGTDDGSVSPTVHAASAPAENTGSVWARRGIVPWSSVESSGVMDMQWQGEEKPTDMRETSDAQAIGRGRIRTCEGISQRIYSPSLLAAQAHARPR